MRTVRPSVIRRSLALPVVVVALLAACAPSGAGRTPPLVQPGTNHAPAAASYAYPAASVHDWLVLGPRAVDYPEQKIAFLTFDDGPSADATPAVLDALKANEVPATFFVIAGPEGLERTGPELVRRTITDGNAVCIHSFSHDYGYLYPDRHADAAHVVADQQQALAALRTAIGPEYTPNCFRYPGGHMSWKSMEAADDALAAEGMSWIDWNAMTGDAAGRGRPTTPAGAAQVVQKEIKAAKDPHVVVILMHDAKGKKVSTQALPQIVADLRAQGYSFGVIS